VIFYTRAIKGSNAALSPYGGTVWICPTCDYYPWSSELPHAVCLNCGENLEADGPEGDVTTVAAVRTSYGWKAVKCNAIGQ